MINQKIPKNMEYLGRLGAIVNQMYDNKKQPLGVVMDKRTGEHYVILDKLGTMISYKKYYK
ncbi:hypothetical protein FJZ53_02480 [Candidatus Woesearchaeota archaeon]|nr:hypothetical protein [Candidatus Woesearchaeota archaeon]